VPAIADVNIGFLWILAVAGVESYGIILAGWSSNNNYSLLGALRSSAQMISYELPMGLFLVSILMLAGSFSLVELVSSTREWWEWLWLWLMFPFFFICILAETNRSPFDLPETENELIAGYQTEYGGMKFSLFMIAEYINMITTSTIMATLFFGGWRLPFGFLEDVLWLGPFVLLGKVIILLFVFIWVRASIGRPRYDQLMNFNWKFLLPLSLVYMIITALLTLFFK
jgi:NADH-quinone oxidoreductase subunit H